MVQGDKGQSDSIVQQRTNVRRIFNKFRSWQSVAGKYQVEFDALAEGVVCSKELHEEFATYLVNEDGTGYVQEAGQWAGLPLSLGSVEDYLGCLLNLAAHSRCCANRLTLELPPPTHRCLLTRHNRVHCAGSCVD